MFNARNESRIDVLRDACVLLQDEVLRLADRARELAVRNAELEGRSLTQEELALLLQQPVEPDQSVSAAEPSGAPKGEEKPTRKPQKGHGPRPQPKLPIRVDVFELLESERTCSFCDGTLEEMGDQTEDSEQITVAAASYVLVLQRRTKYRCSCNAKVVTAPGPPKLIPGGRYSPELAAESVIEKFCDHIPLARQVERMRRAGVDVTTSALWDQHRAVARVLSPVYEILGRLVLEEPLLHADETSWRLMGNGCGPEPTGSSPFAVWTLSTPSISYYAFLGSKSMKAGRTLLGSYSGIVVADGYKVYDTLARSDPSRGSPGYQLVHCWAHVLRKFREIADTEPRCEHALSAIGDLYEIERELDGPFPGDVVTCELRKKLRQERSKPIIDGLFEWATQQGGLRRSAYGKAMIYMLKRWKGLTAFLDDGRIPLDNNRAERALRPVVLGRKNHLGSKSRRGTQVAAVLYTLVDTAKQRGVDPRDFLRKAIHAALESPPRILIPGED